MLIKSAVKNSRKVNPKEIVTYEETVIDDVVEVVETAETIDNASEEVATPEEN